MKNRNFKKLLFIFLLAFLAILERLWFDLGPNVEFITTLTIFASLFLGRRWGIGFSLFVLGLTDAFLGNNQIMVFTWSAFALECLVAFLVFERVGFFKKKFLKRLFISSGMGASASVWFFLWTNFGVWFLDSWGMYPKTFSGLLSCYLAGLPFLKINLFTNMLFLPIGLVVFSLVFSWRKSVLYEKGLTLARVSPFSRIQSF